MRAARSHAYAVILGAAAGVLLGPAQPARRASAAEPAFTEDFRFEECRFEDRGANPLFPLEPGVFQRLEGESDGEEVVVVSRVTRQTRRIELEIGGVLQIVKTRVVKETEYVDGELVELSFNYFAVCSPRNDVAYFGEDVFIFEDGELVSMEGAWLAGQDGAMPGLIMPGTFLLGSRYQQEVAPEVAEDRAEHTDMGLEIEVPAGVFGSCVEVVDTNPLDPGSKGDVKVYCPGVGLAIDEDIELVEFQGL